MKLIILNEAKEELRIQVLYCRDEFGRTAAIKFRDEVKKRLNIIETNPNIGVVEPEFTYNNFSCRTFFVPNQTRIVYTIIDNHILVLAFWNTRQSTSSIIRNILSR